ncbi:MAG: hypothetical protein H6709_04765 [Kofleriaceae bacterium]|nr:hypothetical protein [Myxococcales bacterium]MCB9561186.1 hypothetical protein [Kofleriaceae bacterium]MCB9571382.1 hypothetical protein [Kofleriaceae bacterium]
MAESRSEGEPAGSRTLHADERSYVDAARRKAFILYEGRTTPHRSCGIALAETFGLATPAYQALRRGGITGEGACGAIRAGEQVLGELLGDPDPTGAVTDALRVAITWYQGAARRIDRGASPDYVCNNLTRPLGDFAGAARKRFCTDLAAEVAALTAEALVRFGAASQRPPITPIAPAGGASSPDVPEVP